MYFKDPSISSPLSQEKHTAKYNSEQNLLLTLTPKLPIFLFFLFAYI